MSGAGQNAALKDHLKEEGDVIATGKLIDVTGAALATGWAALGAAAAGAEGLATSYVIFAACCGSATAVLFRLTDSKRPQPEKMWAKASRHAISFVTGSAVGVFMGSSLASNTPLDEKGAIFLMGLSGHTLVALALSERFRRWALKKVGMGEETAND